MDEIAGNSWAYSRRRLLVILLVLAVAHALAFASWCLSADPQEYQSVGGVLSVDNRGSFAYRTGDGITWHGELAWHQLANRYRDHVLSEGDTLREASLRHYLSTKVGGGTLYLRTDYPPFYTRDEFWWVGEEAIVAAVKYRDSAKVF